MGTAQVSEAVRDELNRLPVLLRTPLKMRFVDGLSIDDVSRALGISQGAAKSRIHRACIFLQERMLRHFGRKGLGTLIC